MKHFKSQVDSYVTKGAEAQVKHFLGCWCSWFFISVLPQFQQPAILPHENSGAYLILHKHHVIH